MEALGLTWFDAAALAVIVLSGIMAFARGLIREVFSIVGFVVALIAGYYFAGVAAPFVSSATGFTGIWATLAGGLAVFLVVFILITLLTMVIARSVHRSTEIGSFDRAAGLAFGVLRGVLVIALFIALMTQTREGETARDAQARLPAEITDARLFPVFNSVADLLRQVLPRAVTRAREVIEENRGAAEDAARGAVERAVTNGALDALPSSERADPEPAEPEPAN
jgi:membrane protein required for colicin V production